VRDIAVAHADVLPRRPRHRHVRIKSLKTMKANLT